MRYTIVCGFPGVGKTSFAHKYPDKVTDSDSSVFRKDPKFPINYVDRLLSIRGTRIPLASTHFSVLDLLESIELQCFLLVYPRLECKAEYLRRYECRGSSSAFIGLLDANWEAWINALKGRRQGAIQLGPGEYLSDIMPTQLLNTI